MSYIKDVNVECIDDYRIQIGRKTPDNKQNLCAGQYGDLREGNL